MRYEWDFDGDVSVGFEPSSRFFLLPEEASETASGSLFYHFFCGDFSLRFNKTTFVTDWGWVPALDLPIRILFALAQLDRNTSSSFKFSEGEAAMTIARISESDDLVTIGVSYSTEVAQAAVSELRQAFRTLVVHLVGEMAILAPGLEHNNELLVQCERIGLRLAVPE